MMDGSPTPLFVADVFAKVLLATFAAVALGWVLAILAFGHLAVRDIVGSVISAVIFAYMVHLWIVMAQRTGD